VRYEVRSDLVRRFKEDDVRQVRLSLSRGCMLALAVLAAAVAALAGSASPARAGLGVSCPDPTWQAFAPWSDFAHYAYVPNGGFEGGAAGWSLTGGAKVVAGNSTFFTHGAGERYSLSLPPGSTATSPPMCISLLSSKMRFFAANLGSPSSHLKVQVVYGGGVGGLLSLVTKTLALSDRGSITAGPSWGPSPEIGMLSGTLPLLTRSVQFRFVAADASGAWLVDDVYLDPLFHG
jgi:hypothetical protein